MALTERNDILERAGAEFGNRLPKVTDADWDKPTPCEGWTVRDLVNHAVRGTQVYVDLLHGASREDVVAKLEHFVLTDDPVADFYNAFSDVVAAFNEPGAYERTVHHHAGDISGDRLWGQRVADLTLHAWDLARAIGVDETLDAELVELLFAVMSGAKADLAASGVFGTPSDAYPEGASTQDKLLILTGRTP